MLQVVWFFTRPNKRGVKCVVCDRERVLLVRHTYGSRAWDLPGGGVKRRESPRTAARREMEEELGLDVEWTELGQVKGNVNHRHDTIHCFGAQVPAPHLRLAEDELSAARWFTRSDLPSDVGPYVHAVVSRVPAVARDR